MGVDPPQDCKFTKTHEWVRAAGDLVVMGITDHAQAALGDITFIELPAAGTGVEAGGELGVIESVKAAGDLYAPVSGEVAEVNRDLKEQPELVNASPYAAGWMVKLRGSNAAELAALMDAEAYRQFLAKDA